MPLALAIAAAHIATRPDLSLAKLVAELANAATRLDALTGDDSVTDLRTVFSYSYEALGLTRHAFSGSSACTPAPTSARSRRPASRASHSNRSGRCSRA